MKTYPSVAIPGRRFSKGSRMKDTLTISLTGMWLCDSVSNVNCSSGKKKTPYLQENIRDPHGHDFLYPISVET